MVQRDISYYMRVIYDRVFENGNSDMLTEHAPAWKFTPILIYLLFSRTKLVAYCCSQFLLAKQTFIEPTRFRYLLSFSVYSSNYEFRISFIENIDSET